MSLKRNCIKVCCEPITSSVRLNSDAVEENNMADVKIAVRDNGPFLVTGAVEVTDADGNTFDLKGKETIALCRCGVSKNRPFCDGAHKDCSFESAERAGS